MMYCPSCGQDGRKVVQTRCIEENPEGPEGLLEFAVCIHCDYGINEHTEGTCDCPQVKMIAMSPLLGEAVHTVLCPGDDKHVPGACEPYTTVMNTIFEHEVEE